MRTRAYHGGVLLLFPKSPIKFGESFIRELATRRGAINKPPAWKSSDPIEKEYKSETREFIRILEKLVAPEHIKRTEEPPKEDLLRALDIITESKKILIFVGKNTASGLVQPDGPAAAALIANALVRVNKVPVIVSDEKNARMIKCIADKAPIRSRSEKDEAAVENAPATDGENLPNPDLKIGKYLECHYIEAVNGVLVKDLAQLIEMHHPDAAMFIGIPGSQSDKDECLDDEHRHIDDFNVAFDKALELCHSQEIPTIAICSSKNDVGMGGVTLENRMTDTGKALQATKISETGKAQQAATSAILADQLSAGALALSTLTTLSHRNNVSFEDRHVRELIETANRKAEKGIQVSAYRQNPRFWRPGMPIVPPKLIDNKACLGKLQEIADLIISKTFDWPQRFEHFRDYGATVQHLVLFDSSDGAFIAANDYLGFLRVNSNFDYKITLVTDHAKAPYGELGKELFSVVVNGIHYSALQSADAIVMVCNSACSKSLAEAQKIVKAILKKSGTEKEVEVINLIETTAKIIARKGGQRPVILCTEVTAKNKAYETAISQELERVEKEDKKRIFMRPCVIACGSTELNATMGKKLDLASIVNRLAHKSNDPATLAEVKREINRYVLQMPIDTTVIFLACTHYPALLSMLKESVKEYFTSVGRADSIPEIVDPIKYQAIETIKRLKKDKNTENVRTGIEVHTTAFKKVKDVKSSLLAHTGQMDVEALVGAKRKIRSGEIESGDDEFDRNDAGQRESGFVTPNGIALKQVKFDGVDPGHLRRIAAEIGMDIYGEPLRKSSDEVERIEEEKRPAQIED
jgi:glutamate racemase